MENEGILRLDRILTMAGMALAAILMLLFEGGASRAFFLPICIAVSAIALLTEVGYRIGRSGKSYVMPHFSLPLLMLAILAAASLFWSVDMGRTFEELPKYLLYFLAFWAMSRMVAKQRQAILFIVLLLSTAIIAYSLYNYAFLGTSQLIGPTFPFLAQEEFSTFALVILAFSLGVLMNVWIDGAVLSEEAAGVSQIVTIAVSGASAVLSAAALFMSSSPITLLIAIVVLVVIVAVRGSKNLIMASSLIIGALAIGLMLSWLLSSYAPAEGRTVTFLPALRGTVDGFAKELEYRTYHWVIAIKLGFQRFVAGFGLGTFKEVLPLAYIPADFKPGPNAESFALQLFAELGILGLLSFFAFASSVIVSLRRRVRMQDKSALSLFAPVFALLITLFVGGGYSAPVIAMLFFMLAGVSSAERQSPEPAGKPKVRKAIAFMLLIIATFTAVLSWQSMKALAAKDIALEHLNHGEYEEAVIALRRAIDINPYDKELFMDVALAESSLAAAGAAGHTMDTALRYAEIAVDSSPYSAEALAIRGSILKSVVEDESWLDDFKQAAEYSADDISAELTIVDDGIMTGNFESAGDYIDLARMDEPLLAAGADTATVEGVSDLSSLVKLEALSYALAIKSGDKPEEALRLQNLKELEKKYPVIHEFVRSLLERYGIADIPH